MVTSEINLLSKVRTSTRLATIERVLSSLVWISLVSLCVFGVLIGSLYLYIQGEQKRQEDKKNALMGSVRDMALKEGILVSLKKRASVASKALESVRPHGNLFPLLDRIAPQPYFTSLSIDDVGRSTVTLELPNVDEAITTIVNVVAQFNEKRIRSPQLVSFALKEAGLVQLSISFIANL